MTRKDITKLFKRFLITFICMSPIFIGIGFLLVNKVTNFVMVTIFVVTGGAGLAIEEFIHFKRVQKREELKNKEGKNNGK